MPWSILAGREVTDGATQEAMLALPYAFSQLDLHEQAASHYSRALNAYAGQFDKLSQSIRSIDDGRFLAALSRDEVREDEDWVIRLRALPDAPETYYLLELLASNNFQTGLENYLDLLDLRRRLTDWAARVAAATPRAADPLALWAATRALIAAGDAPAGCRFADAIPAAVGGDFSGLAKLGLALDRRHDLGEPARRPVRRGPPHGDAQLGRGAPVLPEEHRE